MSLGLLVIAMFIVACLWPLICVLVDGIQSLSRAEKQIRADMRLWGVKMFLIIHAIYGLREWFCPGHCIDWREYGEIWLANFLLFSLTYVPFMLYARYRYFHAMVGSVNDRQDLIQLQGEGKEVVTFPLNHIMYLEVDDNYVDICLADKDGQRKEIVRSTLGGLESQLARYPQFVRIHRSVIVNMKFALKPHSKGSLTLMHGTQSRELPVSRSYQPRIDELFAHPK